MLCHCRDRAAWLRRELVDCRAARTRASCLDSLAYDFARRLDLAEPSAAPAAAAAPNDILERGLAACQPYMHPEYRIMFNDGPIMAAVRRSIEAQLGRTPVCRPQSPAIVAGPPHHDPAPFTAGPQLGLFA
jgi:hypothetical protein